MWEFLRLLTAENPIAIAVLLALAIMSLVNAANSDWVIKKLLPVIYTRDDPDDDARQNQISRMSEAGTVLIRTGFGLNASAAGATLLLVGTLIRERLDATQVVEVLMTLLVGIVCGLVGIIAAFGAEANARFVRSLPNRTIELISGMLALSHFVTGSIQLIDALLGLAPA